VLESNLAGFRNFEPTNLIKHNQLVAFYSITASAPAAGKIKAIVEKNIVKDS